MLDDVPGTQGEQIVLTIDGRRVEVAPGTTLWEAARAADIEIPVLCHEPRLAPVGVCRLCVVDVGERTLAASCVRLCESGMEVRTDSEEIETHRAVLTELLMADQPPVEEDARATTLGDNALHALADRYDARGDSCRRARTGSGPPTPARR